MVAVAVVIMAAMVPTVISTGACRRGGILGSDGTSRRDRTVSRSPQALQSA
jgi:hypothetical protein